MNEMKVRGGGVKNSHKSGTRGHLYQNEPRAKGSNETQIFKISHPTNNQVYGTSSQRY